MQRMILALTAGLIAVAPAHAINRYNIDRLSCGEVQDIIAAEGAAILRYTSMSGSGMTLYNRFVRHGGLCPAGQVTKTEFIPTADTPECPVKACRDPVWLRDD
ncbi:MAG: hypothetical protein CMJ42_22585 [Phyllobacteriaceae bacterium]|nr:hypothetical protein [Phyllobacteriaceae bacterium]MBA91955.1 hypothetical protein [Phyllobacteriaceae bacterium]